MQKNELYGRLFLFLRSKEKCVGFDDVEHIYSYKGRGLTSVTRLVRKFFPKFDASGISENLARKELGKNASIDSILLKAKELRATWKSKMHFGTLFHNLAEFTLQSNLHEILDTSYLYNLKEWKKEYAKILPGYSGSLSLFLHSHPKLLSNLLYTELIVWDSGFSVAGQIDFLTWNEDGSVDLWDWKTNSNIIPEGVGFGKFGFGRLAHLHDTNFSHYSLQLSIYGYLLERWGLVVRDLNLVHARADVCEIIKVPYLKDEAGYILESNKE